MNVKRWRLLVSAVVVLVILGVWGKVFWFTEVFTTARQNESNRAAVVSLHHKIGLGDTREQVLMHYYAIRTEGLRLHCDSPDTWTIRTPLELGASNWGLGIEFDAGRVSALRVRTMNGPKPDGSPDDKQTLDQGIRAAREHG